MRHFFRIIVLSLILFGALDSGAQSDDMTFFVSTWNAEQGSTIWRVTLPDEHMTEIATFDRFTQDTPVFVLPMEESERGPSMGISVHSRGMMQTLISIVGYDETNLVVVLLKQVCTRPERCLGTYDFNLLNINTGEMQRIHQQPFHINPDEWAGCYVSQVQIRELSVSPLGDYLTYALVPMSLNESFTCSQIVRAEIPVGDTLRHYSSIHNAEHYAWSPDGRHIAYAVYAPCENSVCPVTLYSDEGIGIESMHWLIARSDQYGERPVVSTWLDNQRLVYIMQNHASVGDVPQTLYRYESDKDTSIALFPLWVSGVIRHLTPLQNNDGEQRLILETSNQLVSLEAEFPNTTLAELTISTAGMRVVNDRFLMTQVEDGCFILIDADLQTTAYDFSDLFPEDAHISDVFVAP